MSSREVRRCTTRHSIFMGGGGGSLVEDFACGGGVGVVVLGVKESGVVAVGCFGGGGGESALSVERRREYRFFVDIVYKVMIVFCNVV
jgi:hypothetical protein